MTAREPINTDLIVGVIRPLYAMIPDDVEQLTERLEQQMVVVYRQTIQLQLNLYRCQRLVTGPDAQSQAWIENKAQADAESIARTYRRELENQIKRIYESNPRSNRFLYMRELDAWATRRNQYKLPSIALNTMTAVRRYATDRFIVENGIKGKFVLVGPPPVCLICIRIKAKGPMTFEQTQQPRNQLPAHVNCVHQYGQLIPTAIDCENAWTG